MNQLARPLHGVHPFLPDLIITHVGLKECFELFGVVEVDQVCHFMKNKIGKLLLAERLRTEREIQPPLLEQLPQRFFESRIVNEGADTPRVRLHCSTRCPIRLLASAR